MKVSIIVPVYNEERTLRNVLLELHKLQFNKEIIVVDDCSCDRTLDVMDGCASLIDKRLCCECNHGKGFCIKVGITHATGDIIVIQDADMEYDPKDIPALIRPIIEKRAVAVYGSRFIDGYMHKKSINYYGNRFVTFLTNLLYGAHITDMETGYKAFSAPILKEIALYEDRFGFEPEITAKLLKINVTIKELPVSYNPRTYAQGKKINWKDGLRAIWVLISNRFAPDRFLYQVLKYERVSYVLESMKFSGPVLDIGCGDKFFINQLKVKAVGLDRIYGDEISSKLPFDNGSFDYVTMLAVIEHFDNPTRLIKECHRVLSDEGRLVITTPAEETHKFVNTFWPDTHKKYYNLNSMQDAARPYFELERYEQFELGMNHFFIFKRRDVTKNEQ